MDTELRTNLRRNLIDILFGFASPSMQQLWVTGHPEIIVTFTETMCGWFDDLFGVGGLEGAVEAGWLSSEELRAFWMFHAAADAYEAPPSGDEAEVLRDPRWAHVVWQAQTAWVAVRGLTTDARELQQMDALEAKWGTVSA